MPLPGSYKVIVGVTGGIAAYKACELVRLFKKAGHEVRVVMTASAENFVSALTFHSLSGEPVLRSLKDGVDGLSATSHIDLAQWGDLVVVAPATANFMAKAACGIADDALLTEFLAFQGPIIIAPAMNTRMWDAAVTRENLARLQGRGVEIVGPASGDLACGETGAGKMSEPAEIFAFAEKRLAEAERLARARSVLAGKTVLVTSGPTRAYIDKVRFITNRSSGRMGHAIAEAASKLGAKVVLVTGPVEERFAKLDKGQVIEVETGAEMLAACREVMEITDVVFATAAVADFEMPEVHEGKLRREGNLTLEMTPSVDVLGKLGEEKRAGQIFFGFAAEAGEGAEEFAKAIEKIRRKKLDYLALNNISRKDIGFDAQDNEVYLFHGEESPRKLAKVAKTELAEVLVRTAFGLGAQL